MRIAVVLLAAVVATATGPKAELAKFSAAAGSAMAAYRAGNYPAAQSGFADAAIHAPQRPAALYYLASSAAHQGDTGTALATLKRYAEMGVPVGAESPADFAALPGAKEIARRLAANKIAACPCETIFRGTAAPFIAEGLARDAGRLFVGGVAARRIVAITNGQATDFVSRLPGFYSPFGMVADKARGILWVSAAVLAQSDGATKDTLDASALIAFDLARGALRRVYPLGGTHDLGDIALAPDGTVYVSDSLEGSLFRLAPNGAALQRVGPAGMFASAQGMAVSSDGKHLLVADYEMGLLRVDLATQTLHAIAIPGTVTTIGIDGLARLANGDFVATQNAFQSARVLRLHLLHDWSALQSATVLAANAPDVADPTLVVADGDGADLVGISQWATFGDGPKPAHTLPAWTIARVASH